eukprot:TRINITY_DN89099_c0_g1_i1.p1 TRINITY_DN89099_c0_g1~~TRINITY_DN89099_c0_g1_i1.p1  ORF type:complete len:651 (+),score=85.50 TRINITY_DN89099_c0_g1_i1:76-2028(+)
MAGYGASLEFDKQAMDDLPIGKDPDSTARRKALFRQADMNGNGICSLAECDRLIVTVLHIEGVSIMKPVINRAFHGARDIVPSVGSFSPHYVDLHEFRFFLIYLKHYLELFIFFSSMDSKVKGKYSDRRLSFKEFEAAIPQILAWGVDEDVARMLRTDPPAVFRSIDDNGGAVVMFDEFAHWALWHHLFQVDGEDDGMEEALDVLRKQKPNLCGKDLTHIKAAKAKYRADARISGQGCLGGDPSLAGGYEEIPDGAKELVAGRHYPGGLEAFKAAFHGQGQDKPGRYRTVAQQTFVSSAKDIGEGGGSRLATLPNGSEIDVVEVEELDSCKRVRARISAPAAGWISLLNTKNAFRWAVQLREAPGKRASGAGESAAVLTNAWRESMQRVEEANNSFAKTGVPECINGCGQPRFGRYPTCCTHCTGSDGPHARSCVKKGYDPCVNGCGHPQFGKYDTCCTHCKGADGPHARGCQPMCGPATRRSSAGRQSDAAQGGGRRSDADNGGARRSRVDDDEHGAAKIPDIPRSTGRFCEGGCGRQPFRNYPTCCTHCKGTKGPHARDCDSRAENEGSIRDMRTMFFNCMDRDSGLSYGRFRQILSKLLPESDIDCVIAQVDANRNGVVEIDEFLSWLQTGAISDEQQSQLVRFRDS